jgi:hypothetical protein
MVVRERILKSVGRSWLIMYRESRPLRIFSMFAVYTCRRWLPLARSQFMYNTMSACLIPCYACDPLANCHPVFQYGHATYAIMLTCLPLAFSAMLSANFAERASMLPLGGTAATITSMPLCASASVMPRQYCMPGINCPASRSSSKPSKPWARTMVCF